MRSIAQSGPLPLEFVVIDDGSTDDSITPVKSEFPDSIIIHHPVSKGVSPSRSIGAAKASGDILMFFDAHVGVTQQSIERLALGIRRFDNKAVLIPMVTQFNIDTWQIDEGFRGFGFELSFREFDGRWLELSEMEQEPYQGDVYYHSPTIVGCAMAVHRQTYEHIGGFDASMQTWGMEDVDFGIRAWMKGHPVLCDPHARVGHRFITAFTAYEEKLVDLGANQLRLASKIFSPAIFSQWLAMRGLDGPASKVELTDLWRDAWKQFIADDPSVARAREDFRNRRTINEIDYAEQFHLAWPTRSKTAAAG